MTTNTPFENHVAQWMRRISLTSVHDRFRLCAVPGNRQGPLWWNHDGKTRRAWLFQPAPIPCAAAPYRTNFSTSVLESGFGVTVLDFANQRIYLSWNCRGNTIKQIDLNVALIGKCSVKPYVLVLHKLEILGQIVSECSYIVCRSRLSKFFHLKAELRTIRSFTKSQMNRKISIVNIYICIMYGNRVNLSKNIYLWFRIDIKFTHFLCENSRYHGKSAKWRRAEIKEWNFKMRGMMEAASQTASTRRILQRSTSSCFAACGQERRRQTGRSWSRAVWPVRVRLLRPPYCSIFQDRLTR